jgi:hypothetical protein
VKQTLLFLTVFLALSTGAWAQGTFTYRFDWHGHSNFFHVSFVATEQDLATQFTSRLFLSSISLTNPAGDVFGPSAVSLAEGTYSRGWYLSINFDDFQRGTQIFVAGGAMPDVPYYTAGFIHEIPMSTGPSWLEEGYWTMTQQIPEPSVAALGVVGTAVFLVRRKAR